jgi:ubiquinone/menaquinone biosynthesis C-methylase UbiE
MRVTLGDAVSYSVRRQGLDRDLAAEAGTLRGRVLEIGCGRAGRRGRFSPPVERSGAWFLLDHDVARLPHVCAEAERLPIRSSAFDTVVCLEVLEYVWRPQAALDEFARVLAPGGTLVLSTPFLHRVDAANDYWRFTEPALRRLLRESGFEVVRCASQGHALASAANILRYVVSVQGATVRRALSIALRPLFGALLRWDAPAAARRRALAAFTTGYLVIARRAAVPPT